MDNVDGVRGKQALRAALRAARLALSADQRARASELIGGRLDALPELAGVRRLLGYAAMAGEVDLDGWLRAQLARGRVVCLPRVEGSQLRLGAVTDLDADLAPGWRGLREPHDAGVAPADLDAVIVPGVAFDAAGRRLGQGGGHIDRLLARLTPAVPVIGVAFDLQIVASIPVEPHDRPVQVVVTESRVLRAAERHT